MSEPIKAGDLVMVVRPSLAGSTKGIGTIFRVFRMGTVKFNFLKAYQSEADDIGWSAFRLIRIDPPAQPETTHQPEEIAA